MEQQPDALAVAKPAEPYQIANLVQLGYESVGMFNAGLESPEDEAADADPGTPLLDVLPSSLELNPTTGQVGVGWRLRH